MSDRRNLYRIGHDEDRGLDGCEGVIRPIRVVLARSGPVHAGGVDGLNLAEIVEINCQTKKGSLDVHLEQLFSCAGSRKVRQLNRS